MGGVFLGFLNFEILFSFVVLVDAFFLFASLGARSGTGHCGIRDHYLYGVLHFNAIQMCLRLISSAYSGDLICTTAPGTPEVWDDDLKVTAAAPPVFVDPPDVPPTTMTTDHCPVSYFDGFLFDFFFFLLVEVPGLIRIFDGRKLFWDDICADKILGFFFFFF